MMNIEIKDELAIREIQTNFSELFPGLRLEFFKTGHDTSGGNHKNELISSSAKVGDIRDIHHDGILEINPGMKTFELEGLLETEFGLHAQLFRRAGNIWLETTRTDELTLSQQREKVLEAEGFR